MRLTQKKVYEDNSIGKGLMVFSEVLSFSQGEMTACVCWPSKKIRKGGTKFFSILAADLS